MAVDDIQMRLVRWAEWVVRLGSGAMGYPRECSYTRMQARSDAGFCSAEVDLESSDTEKAVQLLPQPFKRTVQVYYLHGGTRMQQAKMLGCHVRTMERRILLAHGMIQDGLDGFRKDRMQKKVAIPS